MKHFVLLVILHYYKKLHRETFCSVKVQYETFRSNDTFSEIDKSSSKAYFFCILYGILASFS